MRQDILAVKEITATIVQCSHDIIAIGDKAAAMPTATLDDIHAIAEEAAKGYTRFDEMLIAEDVYSSLLIKLPKKEAAKVGKEVAKAHAAANNGLSRLDSIVTAVKAPKEHTEEEKENFAAKEAAKLEEEASLLGVANPQQTTLTEDFFEKVNSCTAYGVEAAAIRALFAPQLKEIADNRKTLVADMSKSITVLNAIDAAKVANVIVASTPKANGDNNVSSWRRNLKNTFSSVLKKAFPDYDFPTDNGDFTTPKWEGDKTRREAKNMVNVWDNFISLGFLEEGSAPSIQDFVEALTAQKTSDKVPTAEKTHLYTVPVNDGHALRLAAIAAAITGRQAATMEIGKVRQA